jgi:hypothetical protein
MREASPVPPVVGRRESASPGPPCSRGNGLANEIDFLELYRQLRLDPDCDLPTFKQAYRRRVSMLHPDRQPRGYVDSRASQRLQQLNAQYEAAMEFHRLHGRLPGALSVRPVAQEPAAHRPPSKTAQSRASRGPNLKILVPIAVVAIGFLFWGASSVPPTATPAEDDPNGQDGNASPSTSASALVLTLGMSQESVRAIEGDPVMIRDELWEYGPSWIRFDHDAVIDWYSSPLHSLKTASRRPPNTSD